VLSVETREVREVPRNLLGVTKPTGPDWKRIPPERRGRWGRFLVEQRYAHGDLTQVAVRDMLDKMGEPLSGPYYSDFETGKSTPSAHWQAVFTRLWNAAPDEEEAVSVAPAASGDIAQLVSAIEAQRGYIETLTGAIDKQRQDIDDLVRLVGDLLKPRPAASVTPLAPVDEPLSPNEQAVIATTLDVTGLPLTENTAAAPSDRPAGPRLPAAPRGSSRP